MDNSENLFDSNEISMREVRHAGSMIQGKQSIKDRVDIDIQEVLTENEELKTHVIELQEQIKRMNIQSGKEKTDEQERQTKYLRLIDKLQMQVEEYKRENQKNMHKLMDKTQVINRVIQEEQQEGQMNKLRLVNYLLLVFECDRLHYVLSECQQRSEESNETNYALEQQTEQQSATIERLVKESESQGEYESKWKQVNQENQRLQKMLVMRAQQTLI